MRSPPNRDRRSPVRDVGPQTVLVDIPIAVLATVEQDHRESVAELRPQRAVSRGRGRVDVGTGQVETQFVGQFGQPSVDALADAAPGAGE